MESGPAWGAFAGIAVLVTLALVTLARASQDVLTEPADPDARRRSLPKSGVTYGPLPRSERDSSAETDARANADANSDFDPDGDTAGPPAQGDDEDSTAPVGDPTLSPGLLLVNVALSQGLLAVLLGLGAWYTRIPPAALGVDADALTVGALGVGIALGGVLYAADELLALAAETFGIDHDEALRSALTPETPRGWAVLLLGVLPVVAGFEELLFRGVLVGAMAAGLSVSPWVLAVVSSLAFALGHGAQGPGGVVVTGVLGFGLAAAFVLTGSLLVVFVAHYLVNALEFVVHEGLGVEWSGF